MVSCVTRPVPTYHSTRQTVASLCRADRSSSQIYEDHQTRERLDNLRDLFDCGALAGRLSYIEESIQTYLPVAEKTDPMLFAELATVCNQLKLLMPSRVAAE